MLRYFYPFIGGMENKALNIASHLRKKGMDVSVVTSRFEREWQKEETVKGVPVIRLPSPKIKIIGALIFLYNLSFYLFKNHKQFQIIHAFQIGYSSAVSIFISRVLKKTSLLSLAASGSGGDIKHNIKTPWGLVFIMLCRLASKIVVLNREMEKELRTILYSPHRTVYIPNGVDTDKFSPAIRDSSKPKKTKTILFTGRLAKQKGLDTLIYALKRIDGKFSFELNILGEGSLFPALNRLVKGLGLSEKVFFSGIVDDVVRYLREADLFVLPSRYEGMSNALLEAMACGVPVIASDIPGNNDIIRDGYNGLLFEDNNVEFLAKTITVILGNSECAETIGKQARQDVVAYYNIQAIAEKHKKIYQQILLQKR